MNTNVFDIKGLTDDDGNGLHFHYDSDDGMYNWTATTAKEYAAIEKRINKIGTKHKDFEVYAWCDVSGFDYLVRRLEEPNYIQISVKLNKEKLSKTSLKSLKQALEDAAYDASTISYNHETEVYDLYNKSRKR